MRRKGSRRLSGAPRVAALLVFALLMAFAAGASASGTANRTLYQDPAGDNERLSSTNYAADISQIEVASQDNGAVKIRITLSDADARLVEGDRLDVLIDYDRNRDTGQSGFDIQLAGTGHSSGGTTFALCRLSNLTSCEQGPEGWASDTPTGTGTHVIEFNVSAGVPAFDFGVVETYTQPGQTGSLRDIAPNSGLYSFEVRADPDGDGLHGTADLCPTVRARGKLDKNKNGCLGPFSMIATNDIHAKGLAYPDRLRVLNVWVSGVPAGSNVVFTAPGHRASVKANGAGTARSARMRGDYRYGASFTVRITKSAFVGVLMKAKVTKSGLKVTRRSCIPATGGGPVACSARLKGR